MVRVDDVMQAVCDYYTRPDLLFGTVDERRLRSPDAHWPIAEARGVLIYLWQTEARITVREIARRLCRDDSTIVRLRNQVMNELAYGDVTLSRKILPDVRERMAAIREAAKRAARNGPSATPTGAA